MPQSRHSSAPITRRCGLRPTWALACAALLLPAAAHASCATNVAQLRSLLEDAAFPLQWEETGMRDGRPLVVSIDERASGLHIAFQKTGEGLLAAGPASVCRADHGLEARFARGGLQLGPAASWLLRHALRTGAVSLQRTGLKGLRIGTIGWSGDFVPGPSRVGLQAY